MVPLPHHFFDLTTFAHRALFQKARPVWQALALLTNYLDECSLGKIEVHIPQGVTLIHPEKISIGAGTIVQSGALIEGPCVIGKNCQIRHGAYVRPYLIAGDGCVLGHCSELKHAVLLDGACAPHFNYVGDSLLGNRVNLGAGVVCANLRLDKKEVVAQWGTEKRKTGLNKFGAVIGDDAQLGCNSVLNPGLLLRKKTLSRACSSLQHSNWTASAALVGAKELASC